jgi:hypothetical protein
MVAHLYLLDLCQFRRLNKIELFFVIIKTSMEGFIFTLDMFPNEILLNICEYSISHSYKISSLIVFSAVCKTFHNVASMHNLWQTALNGIKIYNSGNYTKMLEIMYILSTFIESNPMASKISQEKDNIKMICNIVDNLKYDIGKKYGNMLRLSCIEKLKKDNIPYRSVEYKRSKNVIIINFENYNKIIDIRLKIIIDADCTILSTGKYTINGVTTRHDVLTYGYINRINNHNEKYLYKIMYKYVEFVTKKYDKYMQNMRNIFRDGI